MTVSVATRGRCQNEGCPRGAEPGERFCSTCGLERDLFRRDIRLERPKPRAQPGGEAAGR